MAENLKTSVYRNGDAIVNVTDDYDWSIAGIGAWCYLNNDSQYACPYGKLYNWYAVADPRNVCPSGWHVPTEDDWNVLIGYLDPSFNPITSGGQSAIAGGKMKSIGLEYYYCPNLNATNESGFSTHPAPTRLYNGTWGGSDAITHITLSYGGVLPIKSLILIRAY